MHPSKMTPPPNGAELAYIGDAVLELLVRERILNSGRRDPGKMNKEAMAFVRATAQSEAYSRIEAHLTEEEASFFRRGRNAHGIAIPKSATAAEYRRATGFEALFAYLFLDEKYDRMRALFDIAYPDPNIKSNAEKSEVNKENEQN